MTDHPKFSEKWEYVTPEYLSHDAHGHNERISEGGILATDVEGEVFWIIEAEIEPRYGYLIAAAPDLYAALVDIEMETRKGGQWTFAEINELARAVLRLARGEKS